MLRKILTSGGKREPGEHSKSKVLILLKMELILLCQIWRTSKTQDSASRSVREKDTEPYKSSLINGD